MGDKMNKKAFTLIELLGSIVILGLIALVAFPAILNFLTSSQNNIDEAKKSVIIGAAKEYVNDNINSYKKESTLNKNIQTSTLISEGYITNKDIINNSSYSTTCTNVKVNSDKKYTFEFKNTCS